MGEEGPPIGIDLGTTYSSIAVWRHRKLSTITNMQGGTRTPSYVAFTGDFLVGNCAKKQVGLNPPTNNTVYGVNRMIGKKFSEIQNEIPLWPFKVVAAADDEPMVLLSNHGEEMQCSPVEITSMILNKLKRMGQAFVCKKLKNAVITVPTYFSERQRMATREAALKAELNATIIDETAALSISYYYHKYKFSSNFGNDKFNLLIFDMGGGTSDISVVTIVDGVLDVKSTASSRLAGDALDKKMVDCLLNHYKQKINSNDPSAVARLRIAWENCKILLNICSWANIECEDLKKDASESPLEDLSRDKWYPIITREMFEEKFNDISGNYSALVDNCLREAKMDRRDVDDVLLVGCGSNYEGVRNLFSSMFNRVIHPCVNNDVAVAEGAALYSAFLNGYGNEIEALLALMVTPLSLGIDSEEGFMSVVVPRNTPVPYTKEFTYSTKEDNQSCMILKVYAGERELTSDNHLLGHLTFSGIRPALAGVHKLSVCFNIDAEGALSVSVEDKSTGKKEMLNFPNIKTRLTKDEIEKMVQEAEKVNDEIENQKKKKVEARKTLEIWKSNMEAVTDEVESAMSWLDDATDAGDVDEKMKGVKIKVFSLLDHVKRKRVE